MEKTTKYLRCHTAGFGYSVGDRFEITNEDNRSYYVAELGGGYTKLPDSDGDSYKTWFTLETDADISPSTATTLLPDESLGGVLREYCEVKRKAAVGELVKVTDEDLPELHAAGSVHTALDGDFEPGCIYIPSFLGDTVYMRVEDYVVLEPTEILVIDNVRYSMVDRKAAVGERVIIVSGTASKAVGCNFRHNIGDVGVVDERLSDRAYVNGWYIVDGDYRALEPVETAVPLSDQPAETQIAANIASLALRLTQAEERITALESVISVLTEREAASGPVDTAPQTFAAPVKSAQQQRDEIVERAKADVRDLAAARRVTHVKYIANHEKRTVVALIVANASLRVISRGIAKCAPGEVFNAHIGRAIALHRALGLEVPTEYLDAPSPTEVRVGDVVKGGIVYAVRPTHRTVGVNPRKNSSRSTPVIRILTRKGARRGSTWSTRRLSTIHGRTAV